MSDTDPWRRAVSQVLLILVHRLWCSAWDFRKIDLTPIIEAAEEPNDE